MDECICNVFLVRYDIISQFNLFDILYATKHQKVLCVLWLKFQARSQFKINYM